MELLSASARFLLFNFAKTAEAGFYKIVSNTGEIVAKTP
jgi:hypothetical protein